MSAGNTQQLIDSALQFLVPLRTGNGYNESTYQALCAALRNWGQEWQEAAALPREAVTLLVELFPVMLSCAEFYADAEKARIVNAAKLLHELIMAAALGEAPGDTYR